MISRLLSILVLGAALLCSPKVNAQTVVLKPLADARLRYESVDQAPNPADADAITARIRTGVSVTRERLSALIESEATLAIGRRYFDGVHGNSAYPTVGDPQNIEINRAQLSYVLPGQGSVTVGRQLLELADQRFVGSAAFRQNEQTYDAVHVTWSGLPKLTADISYVWSVRTVNGINGRGAKQQAISGNNLFALLGYATPVGTLTGFAYVVDADEAATQSFRLSSQTYGARFAGAVTVKPGLKLGYVASWARQSAYHRNPNAYTAHYYLAEGSLSGSIVTATVGYEVLSADDGVALTSFQTPYASLFKFQGWTDRFTTTPPDGVRDLYVTVGAGRKKNGRVSGLNMLASWHRFESDRRVRHYGDELNLLVSASFGQTTLSARWARYHADSFATDTQKSWLTAEWSL
ncbi:MAG: hypothetical protein WA085_05075 [Sphingobium sp.]|uniref:hypothetical protein n=1 Tax=Sphingobium sp. CECT 9361 TaxID=2845384 RepID=UPI001E3156F5|nr:hypothetical protein [Sphingobium sp. CECT 9361]CAH0348664.1 hypothetical protein SPH9361_00215 [Sphingobium sp. CECT 9361]